MPRPKSVHAHSEILKATIALMAASGVDATSMDAIAHRAGVSKATIYSHWHNKDALLLEAMAELHGLLDRPTFNSGDTRADMVAVLAYQPPHARAELQRRITPHLIAYSARHPKFGDAWRHQAMEPARRELKQLLQQGIHRGELVPLPDLNFSLSLLLGPMVYRYIFLRSEISLADKMAERVVQAFWLAFEAKPKASSRKKLPSRKKK